MEFLFRSVVEHEVCLAERNLVIELMCPRVSQLRECLVCETTEDYLLLLHLALDEDDHVRFVANSLNELLELGWVLVLVSFVFKDEIPLAILHLLEVLDLISC